MADRRRGGLIAAGVLVLGIGLTGCGSSEPEPLVSGVRTADDHGYHGNYLTKPYVVPDVALNDTEGEPHSIATSEKPLRVVFYGYTKCPDVCQIMMSTISAALAKLPAGQQDQIEVDFVTTDPPRDTGPVLREYLDRFGTGYVGLTGELPEIMKVAEPMKVFIGDGRRLPSGGYEVDHSSYVFGVTGDGVRVIWSQGTSPAEMAADMIKLLKS